MLTQNELEMFTGTEKYFKHPLSGYVYTDGIQYLAEKGECYWLIDKILILTRHKPKLQEFGVWKLTLNADKTATLVCEDGNKNKLYSEELTFTDFPLPEIIVWFQNGTLFLPNEY